MTTEAKHEIGKDDIGDLLEYTLSKKIESNDAEDYVSKAIAKVYGNRAILLKFQLKEKKDLINYIKRIILNDIYMNHKQRKRRPTISTLSEQTYNEPIALDAKTSLSDLTRFFPLLKEVLSPRNFEILKLRFSRGYSVREIAKQFNQTTQNIHSRIKKIFATLRANPHIQEFY
ncbi:MAG: sigma-70 family RNA polymerase sigma factor [Pirellulaceae bacterium]|nr:sigma-70 family RNA polymerase sigma factor [Pirellulaceae bacterium]